MDKPRIMVAKLDQDGHDRGVKVVASAFGDVGFEVIADPGGGRRACREIEVHVVGMSSLTAGHKTPVPQRVEALKRRGAGTFSWWSAGSFRDRTISSTRLNALRLRRSFQRRRKRRSLGPPRCVDTRSKWLICMPCPKPDSACNGYPAKRWVQARIAREIGASDASPESLPQHAYRRVGGSMVAGDRYRRSPRSDEPLFALRIGA